MDEQQFHAEVDALFLEVEKWLEDNNQDIDFESQEGRLTIITPQGSQLILSRQTPLREIWLAAKSGAYHFQKIQAQWCTQQGQTLFALLAQNLER
ncbi:MAG: iron donor protein CyaY [Candidatus Berkiellales bacterium]